LADDLNGKHQFWNWEISKPQKQES
jgi:hypothetical protein